MWFVALSCWFCQTNCMLLLHDVIELVRYILIFAEVFRATWVGSRSMNCWVTSLSCSISGFNGRFVNYVHFSCIGNHFSLVLGVLCTFTYTKFQSQCTLLITNILSICTLTLVLFIEKFCGNISGLDIFCSDLNPTMYTNIPYEYSNIVNAQQFTRLVRSKIKTLYTLIMWKNEGWLK